MGLVVFVVFLCRPVLPFRLLHRPAMAVASAADVSREQFQPVRVAVIPSAARVLVNLAGFTPSTQAVTGSPALRPPDGAGVADLQSRPVGVLSAPCGMPFGQIPPKSPSHQDARSDSIRPPTI